MQCTVYKSFLVDEYDEDSGMWREVERHRRCPNRATVQVIAPDGEPTPGGRECEECANRFIAQALQVLGERWTTKPVDENGTIVEPVATE